MARSPIMFQYGAVFHICCTIYAEDVESSVGGTVKKRVPTDVILRRDTIEKHRV